MTFEASHGKLRPTKPRMPREPAPSALGAVGEPSAWRAERGRFAPGNAAGAGRGWKRALRALLPADTELSDGVSLEARRMYDAILRKLPGDGPLVRATVAKVVRHELAAAILARAAVAAGLETPAGAELDDRALKHGERAERLAVTAFDFARSTPRSEPTAESPIAALMAARGARGATR